MSRILNPWPGLQARPYNAVRQLTIRIPVDVADRIEAVFGGAGFATGVTHTILKSIYDELERQHISSYNPDFLLSIVQRLSTALAPGAQPTGNVPGRIEVFHPGTAEVPHLADTQSQGNKKRQRPSAPKRRNKADHNTGSGQTTE